MIRILSLAIFCALSNSISAQVFQWAHQLGSFAQDEGHDIAIDLSGNVYTTGTFRYTTDFDPDINSEFYLTNNEASNIFIQKLNPSGELMWALGMGGAGFENSTAICTDLNGFVYVVGNFLSEADFDPDTTSTLNLTSNGTDDAFVAKLNEFGDLMWVKQLGGSGTDEAHDVVADNNGNVFITGRFQSTADFDPGNGVFNLTASGTSDDAFVCKLNSSGDFVWADRIGEGGNDLGQSITLDHSGNVICTGFFSGATDFDPGNGTNILNGFGNMDIFILKLDGTGNLIWAKEFGSTGFDIGYALVCDDNDNIYTTGRFEFDVDFDPNNGSQIRSSAGYQDIYLLKLTSSGNYSWVNTFGGPLVEWGQDVALDPQGRVYICGFYQDTVDFDPGASTASLTSLEYDDIFIGKYDASGNYVWANSMGGAGEFGGDRAEGIAVDPDGNVYSTGWFYNSADFDPGAATYNLESNGGFDAFVHRFSQPGNSISEISIAGFQLYPNPSHSFIAIEFPETQATAHVQIVNPTGQCVFNELHYGKKLIRLNHSLPAGVYSVSVLLNDGTKQVSKLIIE